MTEDLLYCKKHMAGLRPGRMRGVMGQMYTKGTKVSWQWKHERIQITSFMALCRLQIYVCIDKLQVDLILSRVNSDIIENIFCQQRAQYHGANTNPNYNQYRTGITSIILGQTTTSKKLNAGLREPKPFALGKPNNKPKITK